MPQNPRYQRPVKFSTEKFEQYTGGQDPAALQLAAHRSAQALIRRGRHNTSPEITRRLVTFTDVFGIDTVASMWKHSPAVSLPGALWRIYALRHTVRDKTSQISHYYARGAETSWTAQLISGVADPPTETELIATADRILTGAYTGDFDVALDRFAAFCRVIAAGQMATARRIEPGTYAAAPISSNHNTVRESHPSTEVKAEAARRAQTLRTSAAKLQGTALELEAAAAQWRSGTLS